MNIFAHITSKLSSLAASASGRHFVPSAQRSDIPPAADKDTLEMFCTPHQKLLPIDTLENVGKAIQRSKAAHADKVLSTISPQGDLDRRAEHIHIDKNRHEDSADTALGVSSNVKHRTSNSVISRAIAKMDALDWPGSLRDCELVLRQEPHNQMALMLRAISTVKGPLVGDAVAQGQAIAAGTFAAIKSFDRRYPTLVYYGLSERYDNDAVKVLESIVQSDKSDRCAVALLLTMHFKRWFWGDHPESGSRAVAIAEEMQEQWPNDRLAMSALFYLSGDLGKGDRGAMDFASRNIMPGDDIYHKSMIQPQLVFDYPMDIQRPGSPSNS